MFRRFAVGLALFAATAFAAAPPISDEALRTTILRAIFKRMRTSAIAPDRIDPSVRDALAGERVHQITAKPAKVTKPRRDLSHALQAFSLARPNELRGVGGRAIRFPGGQSIDGYSLDWPSGSPDPLRRRLAGSGGIFAGDDPPFRSAEHPAGRP